MPDRGARNSLHGVGSSVLKLPMETPSKRIYWPFVSIVAGIRGELTVEGEMCRGRNGVVAIHLDNLFEVRTW